MQTGSQRSGWNRGLLQSPAPLGLVVTILRLALDRLRVISITPPSDNSAIMVSLGLLNSPLLCTAMALACQVLPWSSL